VGRPSIGFVLIKLFFGKEQTWKIVRICSRALFQRGYGGIGELDGSFSLGPEFISKQLVRLENFWVDYITIVV
jgi:hypothetical protein